MWVLYCVLHSCMVRALADMPNNQIAATITRRVRNITNLLSREPGPICRSSCLDRSIRRIGPGCRRLRDGCGGSQLAELHGLDAEQIYWRLPARNSRTRVCFSASVQSRGFDLD